MAPLTSDFCRLRAADAARLAGEPGLPKVRQRLLEAERAWSSMAELAEAVEADRLKEAGRVATRTERA